MAQAVWKAVKYKQKDVVVDTAKLWTTLYHTLPGLMNPIFRRVFGMGKL
ncbi:hypothetical protein [Gloeocapsopsis dulcis]|nr:hypothetical protein [Gloeocapsopsis dulcis]WNN90194.1 hypothetical protein P0S91_03585 [Gloeocapsopsis dulcis]